MMATRTKATTEETITPVSPAVLPQPHNSPVADRLARGKALRERCSRKTQADAITPRWWPPCALVRLKRGW
jgi:hypothetical protein